MSSSMSPISGGGPMVMIWKDMHEYIRMGAPPKIKFISRPGGPQPGEAYISTMRHYNQDTEVIDFRRYSFMEPEDNAKLVERYSNSSIYTITDMNAPNILGYPYSGEFELFLLTAGIYEYLKKPPCWAGPLAHQIRPEDYPCPAELSTPEYLISGDNSWRFWFYRLPVFKDIFPAQGPSVGGTLISIMGEDFPTWSAERPLVKVVSETGIDQHIEPELVEPNLITFYSPPTLVGDQNQTATAQMYFSPDGGRFFRCTFKWHVYDDTKIRWGDTVAISHLFWREHIIYSETSNWLSGSHEQIVTAKPEVDADTNKLWLIRPSASSNNTNVESTGLPVLCGSTVRLMHLRTMKNLHTYFHSSLGSKQQQLYAHGYYGTGDIGDDWVLECEANTRHGYSWRWDSIANRYDLFQFDKLPQKQQIQTMLDKNNKYWRPSTVFRLYHINTKKYLTFPDVDVPAESCTLCSTVPMKELTSVKYESQGDSQRFIVKRQTRVPVPCFSDEVLAKRWHIDQRKVQVGDFVLWRNNSELPCVITGPLAAKETGTEFDTRFGRVLQVYDQSHTIQVEEWKAYGEFYAKRSMKLTSTSWKRKFVLGKHNVHGPLVYKRRSCPVEHVFAHEYVCLNGAAYCDVKHWRRLDKPYSNVGHIRECVDVYIEVVLDLGRMVEQTQL